MTVQFDRVRPRTVGTTRSRLRSAPADAEGKRALFSAAPPQAAAVGGTVTVDCARCTRRTVLTPLKAARALFPSLHLGWTVSRGDRTIGVGLAGREHPSLIRCPACGRLSWARLDFRI